MPITGGYSKSLISSNPLLRRLLPVSLALLFGLAPAEAIPFIHRHLTNQKSIPPSAQVRPNLMQPPAIPPVVPTPFVPLAPIQILVNSGVFPPDAVNRTQPITRAEWAAILVKAIGHNTSLFSEFSFYRDVPPNHAAYVPIEVAREKKLIAYEKDHGFYYPEHSLTYAEAYDSIAHAITGPPPAAELYPHLLQPFTDRDQLGPEEVPAVAKMARVHFFKTPVPQTSLHPHEVVTFEGATPLVTYLVHLIQRRSPLQSELEAAVPVLPTGLTLSLSPTTAILEAQLTVGQSVSFTLVKPVGPLPKESRFDGLVSAAKPAARSYTVQLTTVKTPDDTQYQTNAEFTLGFNPKSRITFFVPGELFTAVTQAPSNPIPTGEPPVAPLNPASAVPSKVVPPFSPPGSPSTIPAEKAPAETLPAASPAKPIVKPSGNPPLKQTGTPMLPPAQPLK